MKTDCWTSYPRSLSLMDTFGGALEAVGVADEKLNAAEDVGARIAQDMDRIRRARIAEGMAQA